MRTGILASGNFIIDIIKMIDVYPSQDSLANIISENLGNGGSPYNILKDLANLKAPFPLEALGLIGDDEKGHYIMHDLSNHGIDTSGMHYTTQAPTSYTDVMTVIDGGRRTFFHNRGANSLLDLSHFDVLSTSKAKIFHLAYLLLLDKLDEFSGTRTNASIVLETAQKAGFLTSTDLVSEQSQRFSTIVPSALPYVNYLFVNEIEAERLTGSHIVQDGEVHIEKCIEAGQKILHMGVQHQVFIHFTKGCVAVGKNHEPVLQGSIKIPTEFIKGTVGAGDAFAAGVLYGLHENFDLTSCLQAGVCAAAACLRSNTSSDGLMPLNSCIDFYSQFEYHDLR